VFFKNAKPKDGKIHFSITNTNKRFKVMEYMKKGALGEELVSLPYYLYETFQKFRFIP